MPVDTPQPAGFPNCPRCPLLRSGTAQICFRCASATFEAVTAPCGVCSRALDEGGHCGNPLCNDDRRAISRISAVAVKTGAIDTRIKWLKYENRYGWARIFGRIVLGYLDTHRQPGEFDLIVANPTYTGPGSARQTPHTELVIEAAADEDVFETWPWDVANPRAIIKTGRSAQSATGNYHQKRAAADELQTVLKIPYRRRTHGKRILVYDDVCTTGLQLDRVAQFLHTEGGAASVEALVLARTPYRGSI
jgi:predicted amidophosphoribosyltransferase